MTLSADTMNYYRRARKAGYRAKSALRTAHIAAIFDRLAQADLVEIDFDFDSEPYDYGDLTEREVAHVERLIDQWGVTTVYSRYRREWQKVLHDPELQSYYERDEWEIVDSISSCVYEYPMCPIDNYCALDMMLEALCALAPMRLHGTVVAPPKRRARQAEARAGDLVWLLDDRVGHITGKYGSSEVLTAMINGKPCLLIPGMNYWRLL